MQSNTLIGKFGDLEEIREAVRINQKIRFLRAAFGRSLRDRQVEKKA